MTRSNSPLLGLATALALLAGCAGDGPVRPGVLDPQAFRAGADRPPAAPASNRAAITLVPRTDTPSGPLDITARAGIPEVATAPTPIGRLDVVDCKIGDINGHPLWASEFFDPLFSGRLRANAAKLDRQAWEAATQSDIDQRLSTKIMQLLMIDEGLATLTPEMKSFGLAAYLEHWRDEQKSQNMGSEILADRAAREQANQRYAGLDDKVRSFQERVLLGLMCFLLYS